uniref:hypothetical protein n=1 Tax=Thermogemmatispora sp. TaxID=1968838 RepID=UPI002ACC30D6
KYINCLIRAKKLLEYALALNELDSETRNEGRLLLAEVLFLLGDQEKAKTLIEDLLKETSEEESAWEFAKAHFIMGYICLNNESKDDSKHYIQRSLDIFLRRDMILEYASSLYTLGTILLRSYQNHSEERQRGLNYLNNARDIFEKCHALLDQQAAERILHYYGQA